MDKVLNKPFRLPSGSGKKFGVYVKSKKTGKIVKVTIRRMVKQFKEFKQGYRYLVRDITNSEKLIDITVLEISEKAIKIEWYKDLVEWYLKDDLPFKFIEELSTTKQVIEDRSHEIHFEDIWYEKSEHGNQKRQSREKGIFPGKT